MQIKNLFLLACLLVASLLKANVQSSFETDRQTLSNSDWGCNLPAPTNFIIDNWGNDWVHLTWDLTNPGYQHRINVYSCADSSLVKSVIVNAGVNDATIFFFNPPLNVFYYEIKAMCTSGDSPNVARIQCWGPIGVGVIADLIVAGFTPSNGDPTCSLRFGPGGSDRCYFSNSGVTTFKVRETNNFQSRRAFGIERVYDGESIFPHFILTLDEETYPGLDGYIFSLNGSAAPPDRFGGSQYEIQKGERIVAVFTVEIDAWTGESYLKRKAIADYFEVVRISEYNSGENPTGGRSVQVASSTQNASAAPNPFTNHLDVYPANSSAESIQLQLFNLSGQKVLEQQFAGGQEQYSLSTEGLANGFYFLRIEADGQVQTLKVIKSE